MPVTSKSKSQRDDVTLKDIAEAVGKSVAAVSRALNNYDDISLETREHIKQVARAMGYAPTNILGIILPSVSPRSTDPYFNELLTSITSEATLHGFDLLVSTCNKKHEEENWTYLRLINSRRVDGIILTRPRWRDQRIELLLEKQFPFVVIGAANVPGNYPGVSENESMAAQLVVEHMIQQGHQKIALVNGPQDLFFSSNFLAGYRKAMETAGLTVDNSLIEDSHFTQKDGYRAGQILLSKSQAPDAIVTADDMIALGVMAAVQDQGLEVGRDVMVTGYGDILLAEYSQPPLTTIHRSTYALGQKACQIITAQLRGDSLSEAETTAVFEPSLVIRQSSDLALWL